jgi:hypothetical protein
MNKRLSNWIEYDGYCAVRIIEGGNVENVADRVAFIEKTPRVRIGEFTEKEDSNNWEFGPKGCGQEYGAYQPSRDWCDKRLVELGYNLNGDDSKYSPRNQREMWDNMQYYMEYCNRNGYVTPQDWIENYKHF